MAQPHGVDEGQPPEAGLADLARQLRDAATRANRPDVAARAEELLALLGGEKQDDDKGNAIIRMLDGLGF